MATKGVPGIPLAAIAAGGVLVWSGIQNRSITATMTALLSGVQPSPGPAQQLVSVSAATAATTPAGGVSSPGGNPGAINGCTAAQTARNRATGRLMAAAYGWGGGDEWNALDRLLGQMESGWCNVAQNPSSTAYGIGQFLDSTWATVGYTKTSDPVTQIAATLAYIKQRYGSPSKAVQFHLANNWY